MSCSQDAAQLTTEELANIREISNLGGDIG